METVLVKEGAGGGYDEGKGTREGSRGEGALNSENNARIRWQPNLIGRTSFARPTKGSEECTWELCPVSNQTSCALSTRTVDRNFCRISETSKARQ